MAKNQMAGYRWLMRGQMLHRSNTSQLIIKHNIDRSTLVALDHTRSFSCSAKPLASFKTVLAQSLLAHPRHPQLTHWIT